MSLKLSSWYLSLAERKGIAVGIAAGDTQVVSDRMVGRSPSTISCEVARGGMVRWPQGYRAVRASKVDIRSKRPQPAKPVASPRLCEQNQRMLEQRFSPEQIAHRLSMDLPDDVDMRVLDGTIYHLFATLESGTSAPLSSQVSESPDMPGRLITPQLKTLRRPRESPQAPVKRSEPP